MNLKQIIRKILNEETNKKRNIFYGFVGLPNSWVSDNDKNYTDKYFENKNYEDYYFNNFKDMDEMFGHEHSLFGTRGLKPGDVKRTSKSFDSYNKEFGPAIVRVLKKEINEESVICDECGWSWKLSEGGDDPYTCHKCGNENSINESIYTRRRLSPQQMDRVFEDSIKYATNRLNNFMRGEKKFSVHMFENIVTNIMMDEFHGELSNWGMGDFPYDEVYEFIKDAYSDKIKKIYHKLFHGKSEMTESELTEKCWPGYTQKGMKTMFGKRYPNCVKKKK